MRRRTITLVVVGLVLALFVLPAAAQAVLEDVSVTADAIEPEPVPYLTYGYEPVSHVVFYGIENDEGEPAPDQLNCEIPDGVVITVDIGDDGVITYIVTKGDLPVGFEADCMPVLIEGPNGQLNFGQFVSNMVHALKDGSGVEGYDKENGPFGQWVKQFTHDDAMKELLKADDDPTVTLDADANLVKPEKLEKSNNGNDKRSDKSKGKNG